MRSCTARKRGSLGGKRRPRVVPRRSMTRKNSVGRAQARLACGQVTNAWARASFAPPEARTWGARASFAPPEATTWGARASFAPPEARTWGAPTRRDPAETTKGAARAAAPHVPGDECAVPEGGCAVPPCVPVAVLRQERAVLSHPRPGDRCRHTLHGAPPRTRASRLPLRGPRRHGEGADGHGLGPSARLHGRRSTGLWSL